MARLALLTCFFLTAQALVQPQPGFMAPQTSCSAADFAKNGVQEVVGNVARTGWFLYSVPPAHEDFIRQLRGEDNGNGDGDDQLPYTQCTPDKLYDKKGELVHGNMEKCFLAQGSTKDGAKCLAEDAVKRYHRCRSKCQGKELYSKGCGSCHTDKKHSHDVITCRTKAIGVSDQCGTCLVGVLDFQQEHCTESCAKRWQNAMPCDSCNLQAAQKAFACAAQPLDNNLVKNIQESQKKSDVKSKKAYEKYNKEHPTAKKHL